MFAGSRRVDRGRIAQDLAGGRSRDEVSVDGPGHALGKVQAFRTPEEPGCDEQEDRTDENARPGRGSLTAGSPLLSERHSIILLGPPVYTSRHELEVGAEEYATSDDMILHF